MQEKIADLRQKQAKAKYLRLNGKYLKDAEKLLSERDYLQASEKLWGAAAQIVKAVAAGRGISVRSHERLWDFVERLDQENPDLGVAESFSIASSLHTNFYEGWMPPRVVEKDAKVIRDFVSKVKGL